MTTSTKTAIDYGAIFDEADRAGVLAGTGAIPTPMVVGEAKGLFSNEFAEGAKKYFVADGVCGFAWVNIKPARGGFVTWLKKSGIGRLDSYYGGWTIWVHDFGQSYERKMAYAGAFAEVLRKHGITAHANGRLD